MGFNSGFKGLIIFGFHDQSEDSLTTSLGPNPGLENLFYAVKCFIQGKILSNVLLHGKRPIGPNQSSLFTFIKHRNV